MTTYASYYIASTGQPHNGYQEHTSKRAAIARAKDLRANLLQCSGGHTRAIVVNPHNDPWHGETLYDWYEHINGGYQSVC